MPRIYPPGTSFTAGELSPRLAARTDFTKYPSGLEECRNLIPLAEGGLMRRSGSRFVAEVEDSARKGRIKAFQFNTEDSHILEFGHLKLRFYREQGQIQSGGSAVEIATPWEEGDLFEIEGTQSADVLYLFHPDHAPRKLERSSLTSWSLTQVDWQDGPYLRQNTTDTTLTLDDGATGPTIPAGTTGITVTASATAGINGGDGFQSTDVGRLIRFQNVTANTKWTWLEITAHTSTTVVTATLHGDEAADRDVASANWRLGAWSDTTGWPRVATFFEQRLFVASTSDQPQTFWATQTADFENFSPDNIDTDNDGTVEDDDALDFTLSADEVNAIRWLSAGEDTLVIGTTGGEWVPSAEGAVLTPLDIAVRRQTTHGASPAQAIRVGQTTLFVQRARRKLREFGFSFETDGFVAPDMTRLAAHITESGIVEMAYAQEFDSLVWAVREDGILLSMTFRRDEDVVAWSRHILGGAFSGGNAVVESVAVIPGTDGSGQVQSSRDRDEVWLIVKRTINGATKRYIEMLERDYDGVHDQEDAYYADSLITYDGAATTSITGLDHLEGETVKVWGDGAVFPEATVSGGSITLETEVEVAQIGLGYTHRLKTLKIEGGNPAGTALGRTKRIYGLTFIVLNSHTLKFGPSTGDLEEKDFRVVSDPMDAAAPLFTGEQRVEFEGDWDTDTRIVAESDDPAPFMLLALVPEIDVRPQT